MTRSTAREIAIRLAYELGYTNESAQELLDRFLTPEHFEELMQEDELYSSYPNEKQEAYLRALVTGVGSHGAELDGYIEKYAIGWQFARIPRVAAAIMRVAMYELLYMPDTPPAVVINEAVKIAKHYEDDKVVSFLNGILGSFYRGELPEEAHK
ncbi:MAG: transcription antitermination factor NusB [Candidatus Onthomonas sp.]